MSNDEQRWATAFHPNSIATRCLSRHGPLRSGPSKTELKKHILTSARIASVVRQSNLATIAIPNFSQNILCKQGFAMAEAYHVYPSARCVGLSFTIDIIPPTINDKLSSFYQVLVHTRHPEDHSVQSPTAPSKALSPSGCSHCTELSIKVKYLID